MYAASLQGRQLTLAIFLGFRKRLWAARTVGRLARQCLYLAWKVQQYFPQLDREEWLYLLAIACPWALRNFLRSVVIENANRQAGGALAYAVSIHDVGCALQRLAEYLSGLPSGIPSCWRRWTGRSIIWRRCSGTANASRARCPYPYILMLHRIVSCTCLHPGVCFFGLDALALATRFQSRSTSSPTTWR